MKCRRALTPRVDLEAETEENAAENRTYDRDGRLDGLKQELIMDEHRVPVDELYARYSTDPSTGLSSEQARVYLNRDGSNELTPPPEIPEVLKFLKQLFGGFQIVLWVGSVVCLVAYILQVISCSELCL